MERDLFFEQPCAYSYREVVQYEHTYAISLLRDALFFAAHTR